MANIRSVCVYCGSSMGEGDGFRAVAQTLGQALAAENIELVYGGGHVGLMGVVADAVMNAGGTVTGIIPEHLYDWEVGHDGLSKLHIVADMHTRKKMMFDLSDAFVALPGGIGTVDEAVEMTTWAQLKQHNKAIIFLNHEDYWRPYFDLIDHIISSGFASESVKSLYQSVPDITALMALILNLPVPETVETAIID